MPRRAVGKHLVDFRSLNVDALTFSGHKFHGPRGIGGLLVRAGTAIQPVQFGGFQQLGLRPGTEFVPPVAGLCKAIELFIAESTTRIERMTALRDRFERSLQAAVPDLVINSQAANRLPQTSSIAFLGLDRQALFMAIDMAAVACSTGSACASGSSEPSPVLLAMKRPAAVIESSLRFSLGAGTTAAEVEQAASRISHIVNDLRSKKATQKLAATSRH